MPSESLADRLVSRLEREPAIVAAWLFGSVARGDDRPTSDVDIAVLTSRAADHTMADLWLDLRADLCSIASTEVDLVVLDHAPVDLVHRVLRDGVLLVERDRGVRIAFEVDARNRFFDMTPIWNEYRRAPRRASG